jgi:hypothetical protein
MARAKRYLSTQRALEWAFRNECAQLDLPDLTPAEERGQGFGMEYVLIQRAKLGGVHIDQSRGFSSPHIDAEIIAGAVTGIPNRLGGRGMATRMAELARSGIIPEWMPGAVPRLVPLAWRANNQTGQLAKSEVIATYTEAYFVRHSKNPTRKVKRYRKVAIEMTPCRWDPSRQQITNVRAGYSSWWAALDHIRQTIVRGGFLSTITLTDEMPPRAPWLEDQRTSNNSAG